MQIDLCYHELDRGVGGWPMEHTKQSKNGQNSKKKAKIMFYYGNSKNGHDSGLIPKNTNKYMQGEDSTMNIKVGSWWCPLEPPNRA